MTTKKVKLKQPKSVKQQLEFEGKEKHVWKQRKKELDRIRFAELEEELVEIRDTTKTKDK